MHALTSLIVLIWTIISWGIKPGHALIDKSANDTSIVINHLGQDHVSYYALNHRIELTLTSSLDYRNPQKSIFIWSYFQHESGYTEKIRAFWDGDSSWKIRFKPHLTGKWSWNTVCSDVLNVGLHQQSGTFQVKESIIDSTPLKRLKVASNKRTLAFVDETPFFWLGDTAWEITWKSTAKQVIEYLDDRAQKGFTLIQVVAKSHQFFESYGVRNQNNEDYFLDEDLNQLNPRYFDYLDFIITEANKRRIVIALVPLWAYMMELHHQPSLTPYKFNIEQSLHVADYIGARYAGDDVIWIVGGDNDYIGSKITSFWSEWAQRLKAASGGWHLMTVHPKGWTSSFDFFPPETEWKDFHMYQSSHIAGGDYTWQAAKRGYDLKPVKPVVNGEPNYEDIFHNLWAPGDTNRVATFRIRPEHVRQAAWESLLSGATGGVTYGANGVWQWHVPGIPGSHSPQYFVESAWSFPGSSHMGVMRNIAEDLDWYSWTPFPQKVLGSIASDVIPLSENSKGMVAYIPVNSTSFVLDLRSLQRNALYQWINPITGIREKAGKTSLDILRSGMKFEPPDRRDWILHVFNPSNYNPNYEDWEESYDEFYLYPVYPNPVTRSASLRFDLPSPSDVNIDVFSVDGRYITSILNQVYFRGSHTINVNPQGLASGVYLIRIQTNLGTKFTKFTHLRY